MISAFEATLALLVMTGDPRQYERVQRIWATLQWLRTSCEADGLPADITEMVIERAQDDLLAGSFPLVTGSSSGGTRDIEQRVVEHN